MGLCPLCAVLSVDAKEPVVLWVSVCAVPGANLGLWAAACLYRITADCALGSAYQQVESVALPTDLQVGNVSVFAVPTC